MTEQLWASVDQYFTAALVKPDEALDAALRDSDARDCRPSTSRLIRASCCIAAEPRLTPTAIQIVGSKGYDGMLVAIVGQ